MFREFDTPGKIVFPRLPWAVAASEVDNDSGVAGATVKAALDALLAGPPAGAAGGDLTGTYPNPTIGNDKVTYAKIQNVTSSRLIGRETAGSGDPEEIRVGNGLSFIGGGEGIGIIDASLGFSKLQNVVASRILGRGSAGGSGVTEELTAADGVSVAGTVVTGPIKRIAGASGAAGSDITWQELTSNSADVTTTALSAAVISTTGVGAGTWRFAYTLLYQTAATSTGIAFGINHTGTVTKMRARWTHITPGGISAGVGDDVAATVAGQPCEGKVGATLDAVLGSAAAGVSVANTDILAVLEGLIIISASGTLEFKIATEITGSAVRVMANSFLELHKIA